MVAKDLDTQIKEVQLRKEQAKAGIIGGLGLFLAIPAILFLIFMLVILVGLIFG